MRVILLRVMLFTVCLGLSAQRAHADEGGQFSADFDDDFGIRPAPAPAARDNERPPTANEDSESKPAEPAGASDESADEPDLIHNTVEGLTGGVHSVSAGAGKPRSFRLALSFDYFRKDDYLVSGTTTRRGGTTLSLSITPIEHLEIAAQLSAVGTENPAGTPTVIQVLGDSHLYAKGYVQPLPFLTVGGDLDIAFLNAVGAVGYQANATGVGLRANATLDLRKLKKAFPLIVRTSLRYYFDNSAKLVRNVEQARYETLSNPAPYESEYRHLLTPSERFAYRINRVDAMSLNFGFEVPLKLAKDVLLSPIAEWNLALPINRQGYDCLLTRAASDPDGCLANEGFSARTSTFTLAVRAQPKVPGLGVLLAVDIATSGASTTVRELSPNAPYSLYLGLSYAYDAYVKRTPPIRIERVEVFNEKVRGHVQGLIIDRQALTPIAHALVHFEGKTLSDLASDENGKFVSYPLDPGPQALTVSASGYEPVTCSVTLPEQGDVETRCELTALPKEGSLRGRVLDATGKSVVGARIALSGPTPASLVSEAGGDFGASKLLAGEYEAHVEADGYLLQAVALTVRDKTESNAVLTLVPKPARSLVSVTAKRIAIKQQVQFVQGSADIAPASNTLLSEIADVLLRNREIGRVEVQGHTDNSGSEDVNRDLSQRRANAVRDWLIKAGVSADRLTAVGHGSSRPLAPNITAQNRARNRRVELVILEPR
jgi:outer membrane protein OmpA-like peptidoglycan-associated protein